MPHRFDPTDRDAVLAAINLERAVLANLTAEWRELKERHEERAADLAEKLDVMQAIFAGASTPAAEKRRDRTLGQYRRKIREHVTAFEVRCVELHVRMIAAGKRLDELGALTQ